ncbi:MAG TPA: hypothetical protein VMM13_17315 [Euzebya sp.]|nr:hypothetical protein [Euzebya sp.]
MPPPGDPSRAERAAGIIHDIGYQRYDGPRLGRRSATRALYTHSLRTAFGLGRSAKAKALPMGLLAAGAIAALILVVVGSLIGEPVISPIGLVGSYTFGATAFVAIVAPELVSRDLRSHVLPLYLSRPLGTADYARAKLAALATAMFAVFAIPLVIMYLGTLLSSASGLSAAVGHTGDLAQGLIAAVIHAALLSAVALPLASLSGRRVVASGLVFGLFLLTAPIAGILNELGSGAVTTLSGLVDPVTLLNGVDRWLFGEGLTEVGEYGAVFGLTAISVTAAATGLLLWRYWKVTA